jgi:hypothetical protein
MEIIEFPEQTATYAKDQPQYRPLPAYQHRGEEGRITCCWALSWRERLTILLTGRIWHQILTFHQPLQPQLLLTKKPTLTSGEHHEERSANNQAREGLQGVHAAPAASDADHEVRQALTR